MVVLVVGTVCVVRVVCVVLPPVSVVVLLVPVSSDVVVDDVVALPTVSSGSPPQPTVKTIRGKIRKLNLVCILFLGVLLPLSL